MLSLHVVKCIIDWRKQLIYNFMLTSGPHLNNESHKFRQIPFIWETENYLLKMKEDSSFLAHSSFSQFFNFSKKSDPFLAYPSSKHNNTVGGAMGIKKLRAGGSK